MKDPERTPSTTPERRPLAGASTGELLGQFFGQTKELFGLGLLCSSAVLALATSMS